MTTGSSPGKEKALPPPEDKLRLSQEGSLFAYNYVTVPPRECRSSEESIWTPMAPHAG